MLDEAVGGLARKERLTGPAGMWCGGLPDNLEASQLNRLTDLYLALTEQDQTSQVSTALPYLYLNENKYVLFSLSF